MSSSDELFVPLGEALHRIATRPREVELAKIELVRLMASDDISVFASTETKENEPISFSTDTWNRAKIYWSDSLIVVQEIEIFDEVFRHVHLSKSDTERFFSLRPRASSDPTVRKPAGGRPPVHDWEGAHIEMARFVLFDAGQPSRADLMRQLKEWFIAETGDHPAESLLREKVGRFHREALSPKTSGRSAA